MPAFTTDSYFHIGQMHLTQGKPCQDYAFSSVFGSIGFAVVSDGCSSGRHTDIGSRIFALSAATAVNQYANMPSDFFGIANIKSDICRQQEAAAEFAKKSLGLELKDMLATCGYVYLSLSGGFANLRGDGVIAVVYKNGEIKMLSCQWDKNTPFYPAYASDNFKQFINFHGGDASGKVLKVEAWKHSLNEFVKEKEELVSIADGISGITQKFSPADLENISFVSVFTDGVMQVGNIAGGGGDFLDWKDVVIQLVSFKTYAGEFAKRRIIRFLKDQQKDGKIPLDDIAYAVVMIEKGGG